MLRLALCTLAALMLPASAWAALGDPFDITDPTPRGVVIGVDLVNEYSVSGVSKQLIPPDPTDPSAPCPSYPSGNASQNVPTLDQPRVCRYAHLQGEDQGSHAKPQLAASLSLADLGAEGMMRGTWSSDGVTGFLVVSSVQVQGMIGGVPGSADPQGDCHLITSTNPGGTSGLCPITSALPWTDLVYQFDIATGNASFVVVGSLASGVGDLYFTNDGSSLNPENPTAVAAFPPGFVGGWTSSNPLLGGFTVGGVKVGADYGDIFGTPIDWFCSTIDLPEGTIVDATDPTSGIVATLSGGNSDGTCETIGGRPYHISANLPTDMVPALAGSVGTMVLAGPSMSVTTDGSLLGTLGTQTNPFFFNDVALFEIPEPSAYLLLGAGVLGLAALRRRRA